LRGGDLGADVGVQAGALAAKHQPVARLPAHFVKEALAARGEGEQALGRRLFGG
jgi:hypothetical protein